MLKCNSTCDATSQSNTQELIGNNHAKGQPSLALKKDYELVVVLVVLFLYSTTWHPACSSSRNNSPREKMNTLMMVFVCVFEFLLVLDNDTLAIIATLY